MDLETHKLVDDYPLDFDFLEELILTAAVRAAHIRGYVILAEHIVAGLVRAADRISQNLKAYAASEGIPSSHLRLLYHLF